VIKAFDLVIKACDRGQVQLERARLLRANSVAVATYDPVVESSLISQTSRSANKIAPR